MANNNTHLGVSLNTTDEDRLIVLRRKRINPGLQESEKEELKQLEEKGRQGR